MIIHRYSNCPGQAENRMIAVLSMSVFIPSNTAVKWVHETLYGIGLL